MNKLKLLLLAGLVSLTSMAQATTLDPNAAGDLFITVGSYDQADGAFDGAEGTLDSVFYNLHINHDSGSGASATGQDTTFTTTGSAVFSDEPVQINIYQDNGDGLFTGADTKIANTTLSIDPSLSVFLSSTYSYYFELIGYGQTSYSVAVSAVPVPAAGILFASALFGAGAFGRRKKKSKTNAVVGAFARAAS